MNLNENCFEQFRVSLIRGILKTTVIVILKTLDKWVIIFIALKTYSVI